ncbi:TonB family protein [Sphingomonas parva]|uniref:TonB family protein n=1 Tax=Sphingomonas parva TaxID=2555898 RepID=A0A4Y8ZPQ0_9SPHN|nr:TonB family protein [Sphingomonas parva]TFI57981.1 TonB family protein [Sphingomonas parva]
MTHDATSLWSSDLAAPGRAAQLLLASIGLAVMPIFLLTYPPPTHKVMLWETPAELAQVRRFHRLALEADGAIRWDGEKVDLVALRRRLEMVAVTPQEGVDFRPDRGVRYELFLEVLTVIRWARMDRLRLDRTWFADAPDSWIGADRTSPLRQFLPNEAPIRLALYDACGGDAELRCEQFAPEIMRGIPPRIAIEALRCTETQAFRRPRRDCRFALAPAGRPRTTCRIRLQLVPGHHAPYWSTMEPNEPSAAVRNATLPVMDLGRSTLACSGPLLPLTAPAEPVDPSPAVPPRAGNLSQLITTDDYPEIAPKRGARPAATEVKLRVGSHGRVVHCTILQPSGSEMLDRRTCAVIRAGARFTPALNAAGEKVAAEVVHRQVWRCPGLRPGLPPVLAGKDC